MVGNWRSVAEVVEEAEKDRFFYGLSGGGITLSGGEPTMQPEFALALLRACRERGLHTAMETCGHTIWEVLASLLPHLDLVLYDLKQIDPDRHKQLTGFSNELILANARRLAESGVQMVARAPIIPGCNEDEGSIRALVQFVAGLGRVDDLHLLPYHRLGVGKNRSLGVEPPFDAAESVSRQSLDWAVALAAEKGLRAQVGG
jgi:pyruvate formate lyase activating enzyme